MRLRPYALVAASVLVLVCATPASAQNAGENKRVLLLFTHQSDQPAQVILEQAMRSTLQAGSPARLELYSEYLDAVRTPLDEYEKELVVQLQRKYGGKKFDLLIPVNLPALKLLLRNRTTLFSESPIVFLVLDQHNLDGLTLGPNVTGAWGESNFKANLEFALKLHPATKRVVVISGASDWDNYWRSQVQEEFRALEGGLEFSYLTGLSISEQKKALAALPQQTVVFFVSSTQDNAGNSYSNIEVLSQICPSSSAPVYGTTDAHLGLGIVGGRLTSFEAFGVEGARIGLRVLAGEKPEGIALHGIPSVPMFDWRELRRWGISEQSLPPGSVVRFKQPSFWDQYKWYIVGTVAACIIEALLIVYLLIVQSRRRRAERERGRLASLVEAEHRHLNETVSNVPGIVWESLLDPQTETRKTTFISDYVEKMLGYTSAEWLSAPPGLGFRLVPKEDRGAATRASEEVMKSGREVVYQHRWRAKDGRMVWVESHLSPMLDEAGKVVGLRGVSIDITEMKLVEDARRQSEQRNLATLRAIPDLMFLQTRDGVYLEYHAKDVKDLFVPPEQFIGKNMRDVLPPELAEMFLERFRLMDESGEAQVVEYDLNMGGWQRWYEARLVRSGDDILSVVRDITERKRAEAELSFQARMLNTVEQAAIATDMSGVVFYWNHFAEKLYGWSAEEVMGRPITDFMQYEESRELAEEIWSQLKAGRGWAGEFTLKRRDGAVLQIWVNDSLIYNDGGVLVGVLGISHDITERKAAEEALRQSESRLRRAQETARVGTWEWDLRTGVAVWSDMIWQLLGLEPGDGETTLERFVEFIHPEDRDRVLHKTRSVIAAGGEYSDEFRIVQRDGRVLWLASQGALISSPDGRPERMIGVNIDITERKQSEIALHDAMAASERNRAQLESVFQTVADGITVSDMAGNVLLVNEAMARIHGYESPDEMKVNLAEFATHFELLDSDGRLIPYEEWPLSKVLRGESVADWELRVRRKDITREWFFSYSGEPVRDERGEQVLTLLVTHDITERKVAEEALRESEEKYRTLFESIDEGFCVFELIYDGDGRAVDAVFTVTNPAFERLTGWKDANGKHLAELIPDLEEFWFQQYARIAAGKPDRFTGHAAALGKWFDIYAFRVGEEGSPTVAVIFSDVTERIRSEEALRQSEERFRNMADTAPVLIWTAGTDGLRNYFNKQWLDFTGRSLEEQRGDGWTRSIHPKDHARCIEAYTSSVNRREPFTMEYRLRRADGSYRWVLSTGTPRFSSDGGFLGYIGSTMDIHDRKESEETLQSMIAEVNRLKDQLQEENIYLREEIKLEHNFSEIVGRSDAIKYVLHKIEQVGPTDSTVLITGETGTGKELVARAIHGESHRHHRPLVKLNCAALSPGLIESELFGHERGAFTGAVGRKVGRFELADGATIFLDEIGELPLELQAKLLRVIQEGEFERLGANRTLKADVRIIAATNRDLWKEVQAGAFREDLFYRLNVFPITMPPLRQHAEDIPFLVEHFVANFSKKLGKKITSVTPATLNALRNYPWPGNVRELANVIERAVINNNGPVLQISNLAESLHVETPSAPSKTLEEIERDYIITVLNGTGWRVEGQHGAARILGLHPSTLRTRMAKLRVQKPHTNFP